MSFKYSFSREAFFTLKRILGPPGPPKPPYTFPVQIGDPVLRTNAAEIKPENINSESTQQLLSNMHMVLTQSKSVGISAPQVGVPLRVFMTELTQANFKLLSPEYRKTIEGGCWDLKVFFNPTIEITNNTVSWDTEGCMSVLGYCAQVPRFSKVTVKGLDDKGNAHEWEASGLAARIIQHEMDHLNGEMYIDKMDIRSFQNVHWQKIQKKKLNIDDLK